jgi:hypothetical protein
VILLALYAGILVLGVVSAGLLLVARVRGRAALAAVIVYGAFVQVFCALLLHDWWSRVPGWMTVLRTGIPFALAGAMIVLAIFGRRSLLRGGSVNLLGAAFWCAVGSLFGYAQLFLGSGY